MDQNSIRKQAWNRYKDLYGISKTVHKIVSQSCILYRPWCFAVQLFLEFTVKYNTRLLGDGFK